MEVVNPFILKNKERMIVFLDQLSSVTDPNPPPGSYIEASTSHMCSDAGNKSLINYNMCKINFNQISFQDVNWQHCIIFVYHIYQIYNDWPNQICQ